MLRIALGCCAALASTALVGLADANPTPHPTTTESAAMAAADGSSLQLAGVLLPKRTKLVIDYRRTRIA